MLETDYGVAADVWSLTSVNELQREGRAVQRWNLLHPAEEPKVPYVTRVLADTPGPVVAATDYLKLYADQIREFVPAPERIRAWAEILIDRVDDHEVVAEAVHLGEFQFHGKTRSPWSNCSTVSRSRTQ